jgi:hypothetical protein
VVGDRGLQKGEVEYQSRREGQLLTISLQNAVSHLQSKLMTTAGK